MKKQFSAALFLKGLFFLACATIVSMPYSIRSESAADIENEYVDVHCHLFISKQGNAEQKPGPMGDRNMGPKNGPKGPGMKHSPKDAKPGPGNPPDRAKGGPQDMSSDKSYEAAGKNLLDLMGKSGVKACILMPPPRTDDNRDDDEVPAILKLAREYPKRIVAAGGGDVLNPIIHRHAAGDVTDKIKKQFEAEAEKLINSGIGAFGEMAAVHLSFSEHHVFEQTSPDHPLFLLLADIAARRGMAIDLHMEAVPEDMPLPPGFKSAGGKNQATLKENITGLEKLLKHNRDAHIVWQHIGWDNTGGMTPALLGRLLGDHPNLFLALRVEDRPFMMDKKTPMPNRIVDSAWKVKSEWLRLFEEYPDRFVVGTDEFVGATENFMGGEKGAPQSFEETWRILDQLPSDLAEKIGGRNARRIYYLN